MTDYIRLPRSALELIPSALHRGILVSLLERADENGQLTISIRGFADEIEVSYQTLRTALSKLLANAIINAIATQRLTQITICNFNSYTTSPRKLQRNSNATANAIIPQSKPTKFIPPTDEEVATYVAEKGYHFNPAEFVPFYQTRGWKMKGGEPMKDWKAGCRYWEVNWKRKYGNKHYYEITSDSGKDNRNSRNSYYSEDFRQHIEQRLSTPDAPEPDLSGYY